MIVRAVVVFALLFTALCVGAATVSAAQGPSRAKRESKAKEADGSGGGDWVLPLLIGAGAGFGIAEVVRRRRRSGEGVNEQQLSPEALQDIKVADPDLAKVIETKPAVPVDSLPEEITRDVQKEIEAAPTPEAAVEVAKRFIRDADVAEVVANLILWPTRTTNDESQYQASFKRFIKKRGYAGQLKEWPRIPWGGGGATRVAIPDFVLRKRVLVELKADLTASGETDRAMGQMLRYLLAFKDKGPAVLAICGTVTPEFRLLVHMYINTWRRVVNLPVTVYFKQGSSELKEEEFEMPAEPDRCVSATD
ncbi:MAG TPA: hypothetical protein VGQ83_28200 [Polyangia bacterium]|jgi:hypothetical protein